MTETTQPNIENRFLETFASTVKGTWLGHRHALSNLENYFISFVTNDPSLRVAGSGSHQSEAVAALKAAMEWVERKSMFDYFDNPDAKPFSPFHDSNGWASGFSRSSASSRAECEALERHILQISFLKNGWNGFFLGDVQEIEGFTVRSLFSRFSCNDHSAGLIALSGPDFPGVCFGYVCDHVDKIAQSLKWRHAFFEAYNYYRKLKDSNLLNLPPISELDAKTRTFLCEPYVMPKVFGEMTVTPLPKVQPHQFRTQYLLDNFGEVPVSWHYGGGLLPLLSAKDLSDEQREFIAPLLKEISFSLELLSELPVL